MSKLQQAFERFHSDNPLIYELYKKFAWEAIDAGVKTLSVSFLTERVRWETNVVTKDPHGFKINNNHAAYYARKLNQEPMFTGMFRTRARSPHIH